MTYFRSALFAVLLFAGVLPASAQRQRPYPNPVQLTPGFEDALARGTRTTTGRPGPNYWTNTAEYQIRATLSPETRTLRAEGTIRYHNRSPHALDRLVVHLRQNLHQAGVVRNRPQEVTGGVHLTTLRVDGQPLVERDRARGAGYVLDGTVMTVLLPAPLAPGATATLDVAWSFVVPAAGAPRMGQDGEVFYLGYWYPQLAVFDDVHGWMDDPYQGNGEFYMGYADYDVAITVPEGWLVAATGTLQNPDAVLAPAVRKRLAKAAQGRDVVQVVPADGRGAGQATVQSPTGALTWRFRAENVRDFAFGASDTYVWDATTATVGDRDGDGRADTALIHAFYRPDAPAWNRSAEFGRFSIEFLSDLLLPYPYPHMTAVEGIIGGGMEYPMMTLIGRARSERSLFGVTFHEISHMWFPMVVGQNEAAFAWMDEGLTSFNTNEAEAAFFKENAWKPGAEGYYRIAGTGLEVEPMRHSDDYPHGTSARVMAAYSKPAVALHALRGLVGDAAFREAYRTYAQRWAYRHPYPFDLFNTFEDVLGKDLDWFWTTMFYETWTLDQAIASVTSAPDGIRVKIEDRGHAPFPAPVRVTYADGRTEEKRVDVETWLNDARTAELTFPAGKVARVEIDPAGYLPDVDRENNVWTP